MVSQLWRDAPVYLWPKVQILSLQAPKPKGHNCGGSRRRGRTNWEGGRPKELERSYNPTIPLQKHLQHICTQYWFGSIVRSLAVSTKPNARNHTLDATACHGPWSSVGMWRAVSYSVFPLRMEKFFPISIPAYSALKLSHCPEKLTTIEVSMCDVPRASGAETKRLQGLPLTLQIYCRYTVDIL